MAIETNTNQVYRSKYFVDTSNVIFSRKNEGNAQKNQLSVIIDASAVAMEEDPVVIRPGAGGSHCDAITVETVRQDGQIKKLRIVCPCGRHTEMNIEYRD